MQAVMNPPVNSADVAHQMSPALIASTIFCAIFFPFLRVLGPFRGLASPPCRDERPKGREHHGEFGKIDV